jgi:ankyrin repeat protein
MTLAEAVQCGSVGAVERLLKEGAHVNELDSYGWTPLNWAAAAGDISMAKMLLKFGASAALAGSDLRTPTMIALAAGKSEMACFLQEAELRDSSEIPERTYCLAVRVRDLKEFPEWQDGTAKETSGATVEDTTIVYLHSDYAVTRSVWRDGEVLFDKITPEWKRFCHTNLNLHVPSDLELVSA